MNGRNVVGQQHDLVGVQLMVVLPYEIGIPDESGLEQLHQKHASAGERIQHVNMFIAQAPAKFMLQHMVGAGQDIVHDQSGLNSHSPDMMQAAPLSLGGGSPLLASGICSTSRLPPAVSPPPVAPGFFLPKAWQARLPPYP